MLFAAACAHSSSPAPSVNQTALGNAYRVILPPGTTITLPNDATAAQLRAVAVNETTPGGTRAITLTAPLQLVSPAYIAERDQAERAYAQRIIDLEEQLTALRASAKP